MRRMAIFLSIQPAVQLLDLGPYHLPLYHSVESHLKFQYSMNTYLKINEYCPEVNQ